MIAGLSENSDLTTRNAEHVGVLFGRVEEALFGTQRETNIQEPGALIFRDTRFKVQEAVRGLLEIRAIIADKNSFPSEQREALCEKFMRFYSETKKLNKPVDDLSLDPLIIAMITSPPLSNFYTSTEGVRYYQPNYQQPYEFCLSHFASSVVYESTLMRIHDEGFIKGAVCDVFYIKKTELLVAHDERKIADKGLGIMDAGAKCMSAVTSLLWTDPTQGLVQKGEEEWRRFGLLIQASYHGWGYSEYRLYNVESLIAEQVNREVATQNDVLLLFYPRC